MLAVGSQAELRSEPRDSFLMIGHALIKLQQPCGVLVDVDAVAASLHYLVLHGVELPHALGGLRRDLVQSILRYGYGRGGGGGGRDGGGATSTSSRYTSRMSICSTHGT